MLLHLATVQPPAKHYANVGRNECSERKATAVEQPLHISQELTFSFRMKSVRKYSCSAKLHSLLTPLPPSDVEPDMTSRSQGIGLHSSDCYNVGSRSGLRYRSRLSAVLMQET